MKLRYERTLWATAVGALALWGVLQDRLIWKLNDVLEMGSAAALDIDQSYMPSFTEILANLIGFLLAVAILKAVAWAFGYRFRVFMLERERSSEPEGR